MTQLDTTTAAQLLLERRLTGTTGDRLPELARPSTLEQALAIQQAVTALWCESQDDLIGGWKCLLPPQDKLVVGPIYARTIDSVPPIALWPQNGVARIEPEMAFFLKTNLPARAEPYLPEEVDAAISRTHMALELIFCRYTDASQCEFPEMLADGLVNQGLFIGPEIDSELAASAGELNIRVNHSGNETQHHGKHPNQHPRAPLYWLVEFLRQQGVGIEAGQAIITGSFAGVLEVPLDTPVVISYGTTKDQPLGTMPVQFTARKAQ